MTKAYAIWNAWLSGAFSMWIFVDFNRGRFWAIAIDFAFAAASLYFAYVASDSATHGQE